MRNHKDAASFDAVCGPVVTKTYSRIKLLTFNCVEVSVLSVGGFCTVCLMWSRALPISLLSNRPCDSDSLIATYFKLYLGGVFKCEDSEVNWLMLFIEFKE